MTVLVAGASGSVVRRLCPALAETAYYLVHTLSDAGFEHNDGAEAVSGEAGVQAWLQRIIYLGGSASSRLASHAPARQGGSSPSLPGR